jgi:dihydropteroate synthase
MSSPFNPCLFIPSNHQKVLELIEEIGADKQGVQIMSLKADAMMIRLESITTIQANIIKQEMLARGGDVVVHKDVAVLKDFSAPILLIGTFLQIQNLARKLRAQPFGLKEIAISLLQFLRFKDKGEGFKSLKINGKPLVFGKKTLIMGIVNCTPDSFSDGGSFFSIEKAINHAKELVLNGADIIDIGGESTRPGAPKVSEEEETKRTIPVIAALRQEISAHISIDTYKSGVAQKAVKAGATIINDISGGMFDKRILKTAYETGVPIVLMHYGLEHGQVITERHSIFKIVSELRSRVSEALSAGVLNENIIIDPGIGFGKHVEDNLSIIKNLECFTSLGYPVLVGASRKQFIGKTLDLPVQERLEGSLAVAVACALNGAQIIRVHDVKETVRACKVADAIKNASYG